MATMRVLITGASGLLGRHLYKEFSGSQSWESLGLAFSRATDKLQKVDITKRDEVRRVIQEFKPTVVIHSAAERRPDAVENQPEATKRLNVEATSILAEEAGQVGATVVFISTDYVFDGDQAPYQIDATPNPLNKYGQSKLEGERVVLEKNKDNIVLRVPVLYGEVENLDESAVTVLFSKVRDTTKNCSMSDYERRYPTHCADVAWCLRELLERKVQDPSLTGIFHWSGDENMTKYDMAIAMAAAFDIPTQHIIGDLTPSQGTKRPYDAHIDPARIEQLGICKRTPFKEGIVPVLSPFR